MIAALYIATQQVCQAPHEEKVQWLYCKLRSALSVLPSLIVPIAASLICLRQERWCRPFLAGFSKPIHVLK